MIAGTDPLGRHVRSAQRFRVLGAAVATLAVVTLACLGTTTAAASAGGNKNAGDVWVDNVGQPAGPGHEMDPHLACANINLWGNGLADPTGTFTIDGWPPSGSQEQTYAASWTYNTTTGGDQVVQVIDVGVLIHNAIAAGDAPINGQGFHFKLQYNLDPQKHKTFWVNCPSSSPSATLWVQKIRSCGGTLPGAQLELLDSSGAVISGPMTSAAGTYHTFPSSSGCPTQAGSCTAVTAGCLTLTVPIPAVGTATYKMVENLVPAGFVDCIETFQHNFPVSQCSTQYGTVTVDASGNMRVTFTAVNLAGTRTLTLPSNDPNTGNGYWLGTQADPALFYDDKG
ncbi:MAG: hypothetical protein ACYDCS_11655 [Candidatus Dormibacteria bacterium]